MKAIKWHQVEEQILAQLEEIGISKDEFHKNFKLDGAVEDGCITVYKKKVEDPVAAKALEYGVSALLGHEICR